MTLLASSTFSILIVVTCYNGLLLTALALYLWAHRGQRAQR